MILAEVTAASAFKTGALVSLGAAIYMAVMLAYAYWRR